MIAKLINQDIFSGMSHLVTHSISEDRYGVVQKDLAKIIVDLLTLLQVKLTSHQPGAISQTNYDKTKISHFRPWNDTKV